MSRARPADQALSASPTEPLRVSSLTGDDPSRETQKQLSAMLARYMDLQAFTATRIGKERGEKMKARREIATKRARAAIRFFMKPDNLARLNAQAIETRSAETTGSVGEADESAAPTGCAPMTRLAQDIRLLNHTASDMQTSGELIARMERNAADPVEQDKARAFYAAVSERDRRNRIRADIREAIEIIAIEQLDEANG